MIRHFNRDKKRNEKMASFIARRSFTTSLRRLSEEQSKKALRQEEKRNPEVYVRSGPY